MSRVVSKRDLWLATQLEKVPCPQCGRSVTRRVLRWKHKCLQPRGQVFLTPEQADAFRSKLCQKAEASAAKRLKAQADRPHTPIPTKGPQQPHNPLPLRDTDSPSS
jgi:hypothetical protein